jgi:DNA processing protein
VPGPITSAASAGCHRLLREGGATLITSADDVLELLGRENPTAQPVLAPDQLFGSGS